MSKLKQALYFPEEMLREIQQEAERLDRPLSWVVQQAWKRALKDIRRLPALPDAAAKLGTTRRWKTPQERDS